MKGWLTHLHECVLTLNMNMGITEECSLKVNLVTLRMRQVGKIVP